MDQSMIATGGEKMMLGVARVPRLGQSAYPGEGGRNPKGAKILSGCRLLLCTSYSCRMARVDS